MSVRRTDVLVIGAGPAGLAAATAAAREGRSVLVLDDSPGPGGQIWRAGVAPDQGPEPVTRRRAIAAFVASGAEFLPGRRVFDASADKTVRAIVETGEAVTAETYAADQLILATGARERFLPFPGWTLPGVFGAGGLQALAKGGYSVRGRRVAVAGSGPLLLAIAAHLQEMGARIVSINEQAPLSRMARLAMSLWRHPAKIAQGLGLRAALRRAPYRTGTWPVEVIGDDAVRAIRLTDGRRAWQETVDLVACGFHLVPNTELPALLGCALDGEGLVRVDAAQRTSVPGVFCAGEPTGIAGVDAATLQGSIAGLMAAGQPGQAKSLARRSDRERRFGLRLDRAFVIRPELRALARPETMVCRCEDVPFSALEAQRSAHSSWTETKLQTRCGMGACQGRICGPAVQTLFGWSASSVRPPIFPVPLGVLSTLPTMLSHESEHPQETYL